MTLILTLNRDSFCSYISFIYRTSLSDQNHPSDKIKIMAQRKSWTVEEDRFIGMKVADNQKLPQKDRLKWGDIADELNKEFPESKRSGKQCRQRWHNQLDPNISHSQWTLQQEKKLFELQKNLGNKWAVIASKLKGRTDNNVKNYFYSTLRKSLRKLNTFISGNRNQLKNAKQFKESSLSKLLAVADHKFDKKINIKKVSAEDQAIQIKNMLIEITNVEIIDNKSKNIFIQLVKKLQQWNKCCKKKKGKKKLEEKQEVEGIEEQNDSVIQEQNQENQEQQEEFSSRGRGKNVLDNSRIIKRPREERSRSRNKAKIDKKPSNLSMDSRKSRKQNKKISKPIRQQKQQPQPQKKLSRQPSIPEVSRKTSSRSPNGQNFVDEGRSSLDLGKFQRKQSSESSQLFKSFMNDMPEQHHHERKQSFSSRVRRENSNMSFLNMIKEVSLVKNQSQNSGINDFLQEEDDDNAYYIDMLRKESSRKEIPMLRDQSNYWNGLYGQALRFEPQISKLRSFKRDSANFQLDYKFGERQTN